MWVLDKDKIKEISTVITSSYYDKWIVYLTILLRKSKSKTYCNNRRNILALQLAIADIQTQLWAKLREGRSLAKKYHQKNELTKVEKNTLWGIEQHIHIHEELIRFCKTICDGIAWRSLSYNRFFIHSASRGFGTGAKNIDNPTFRAEINWAIKITEGFKSTVIINDLTHYLRVGDLTEIKGPIIIIHEIKSGKKKQKQVENVFTLKYKFKKGNLSKQNRRLLELQKLALTKKISTSEGVLNCLFIDKEAKYYFDKLNLIFKDISNKAEIKQLLNPCMGIRLKNCGYITKNKIKPSTLSPSFQKDWDKKDVVIAHSNFDLFFTDKLGNFIRAVVPYSIFPLPIESRVKLISGKYLLISEINITKLQSTLRNRGWTIKGVDLDKQLAEFEKNKDTIFTDNLYTKPISDSIFEIKKDGFTLGVSGVWLSRMTMEFLSLNSFLEMLDFMYETTKPTKSSGIFYPVFSNDSKIWD